MGERNKRTKLKKSMGPGSIWAVAVGSIIGWLKRSEDHSCG